MVKIIKDYGIVLLGTFIMAVAVKVFILPFNVRGILSKNINSVGIIYLGNMLNNSFLKFLLSILKSETQYAYSCSSFTITAHSFIP